MNYLIERIYYLMSTGLIVIPTVLISLVGHELAHAWMSVRLGDPTPKNEGRLSLNPLKHLDPFGTILMVLTGFGWAKPVVVNPMFYKDRKKGMALVSLAGPMSNLLMAVIAMLLRAICVKIFGSNYIVSLIAHIFAVLNLNLMVFNLIPLPPLDGSKVLGMLLPNAAYYTMLQYERYSIWILMLLAVMGVFDNFIGVAVNALYQIIEHMVSIIVF